MHKPKTPLHLHKKHRIKLHNPIEVHFNVISKYHYFLFCILFLSKIPLMWQLMSLVFLTPPMDYYCEDSPGKNRNATKNVCPCENPNWDRSVFTETVQTKYEILCDTKWQVGMTHSMLYLGTLLGAFMFGFLSDKFGRLFICSLSFLIMGVFGSIVTFMPNITSFLFMRVLQGTGVGGAIVAGYVLCVEYCGIRHREVVTALFHIPLNIGHMTLAGVSYALRNYNYFQLAISLPAILFFAMYWCLLESPKWLMDSNRIDRATAVMNKIGEFNKTPMEHIRTEIEEYQAQHRPVSQKKMQFWHIFQHRRLLINFVCMAVNYFVCGMGYYGVSQYIGQMSGNIHVNVAISGTLLLPGTIAAVFLLHVLGRRTFLMLTNFVAGVFMLIVVCIPPDKLWPKIIAACVCNSAFFVSFIIVFLYGVELFPTPVRNSVLGVLNIMCRTGQIIVPFVNQLSAISAGCLFGSLALLGGLLCIPLPETKFTELPSSFEDSEKLPRKVSDVEQEDDPGVSSSK